jgi:hypothetical protein
MLAKSAKDQGFALSEGKSPCRGCGLVMRGGPAALDSAQGMSPNPAKQSYGILCQVAYIKAFRFFVEIPNLFNSLFCRIFEPKKSINFF